MEKQRPPPLLCFQSSTNTNWSSKPPPSSYQTEWSCEAVADAAENVRSTLDTIVYIHDRRPVVLAPDLVREWLKPATPNERAEQMALHQREPAEAFEWFKVGTGVGNLNNHGPELIEPLAMPSQARSHITPPAPALICICHQA
ncbi:hypothetical protein PBOI14_49260 [Pseudomonas sp. Boi14]|nr:hypothetical protein PBOI14_49260 [Pseudomonas sp. Boi14]